MIEIHKTNKKIYNYRNYAKKMYVDGHLPCKSYFVYEKKKTGIINDYFYDNFKKRLEQLNINIEDFECSIKKIEAVIAGDIILQCLTNNYFDSSIDIYIDHDSYYNYKSFMIGENKVSEVKYFEIKSIYKYEKYEKYEFLLNGNKVNLIKIYVEYKTYMNTIYDFCFCKNYYDYNNNDLYIHDFNSILTRSCFLTTKEFLVNNNGKLEIINKIENKIKEYQKKGFSIYINLIHNKNYEMLKYYDIVDNIYDVYEIDLKKELYENIVKIFEKENHKDIITFSNGNKTFQCSRKKISQHENSFINLLLSNDALKIDKDDQNNVIIEENDDKLLEMIFDIYKNGIEKNFNDIANDPFLVKSLKFHGFLPNFKYEMYLSYYNVSISIINLKLREHKLNFLLSKLNYIIYGSFINYCLFGSDYEIINIAILNDEYNVPDVNENIYILKLKRNYVFEDMYNNDYKYYFDGRKICINPLFIK